MCPEQTVSNFLETVFLTRSPGTHRSPSPSITTIRNLSGLRPVHPERTRGYRNPRVVAPLLYYAFILLASGSADPIHYTPPDVSGTPSSCWLVYSLRWIVDQTVLPPSPPTLFDYSLTNKKKKKTTHVVAYVES